MIIGIDCSTKAIHAIAIDSNKKVIGKWKIASTKEDADSRYLHMMEKTEDILPEWIKASKILIEAPIFIQNPHTTVALATVVAGLRLLLHQAQFKVEVVQNRVWKKNVIGTGAASKATIKKTLEEQYKVKFPEQDYYDALGVALNDVTKSTKEVSNNKAPRKRASRSKGSSA